MKRKAKGRNRVAERSKPGPDVRGLVIQVRVSADELSRFEVASGLQHLKPSTWLRILGLEATKLGAGGAATVSGTLRPGERQYSGESSLMRTAMPRALVKSFDPDQA